jgi:DNA-directed RNA polymerase specialized sigma24 family protein
MVGGEIDLEKSSQGNAPPLSTLLERLAIGQDVAQAYERLRMRLVAFFRLRFPVEAESLADETIDRLARRLDDGTPVENLAGYALGIARFVVIETEARRRKELTAARGALLDATLGADDAEPDPAVPALQACLESLGPESTRFLLEYYAAEEGAARIERRRQLAERAGTTLNALRNRALRLRTALEKCVGARLEAESRQPGGDIAPEILTKRMWDPYSRDEADE